jgi:hypothetical protein
MRGFSAFAMKACTKERFMICRMDAMRVFLQATLLVMGFGCFAPQYRHSDSLARNVTPVSSNPATQLPGRSQSAPVAHGEPDIRLVSASDQPATAVRSVGSNESEPSKTNPESVRSNETAKLRLIHQEAAQRYASVDSYIVRLRRREQINGKDRPEEIMLVKFRKRPWSVYFKWLGDQSHGREVVYVQGQHEDKIHTLLAAGDMPLMPAGKRIALAPDSALVRASGRHSIHEAGIGVLIESFGSLLDATERSDGRMAGSLKYLGVVTRPEFDFPCEGIEQLIPMGSEQLLPRGGHRLWMFDPTSKLPVLMITRDETGHEVEYYCYDRFQYPVKLDEDDFDPEKLWKPSR